MYTISNGFYIWGAGTDIGKTVFCSAIAHHLLTNCLFKVHYIKPVDTGGIELDVFSSLRTEHSKFFQCSTFFKFSNPVSPHRIQTSNENSDFVILTQLECIFKNKGSEFIFVEGAGGVASPTLEGNLQCALYAPIKLPIIFVADFRLGGISNTLANIEFARSYGFEIACILCFEGEHENAEFLKKHYKDIYPVYKFQDIKSQDTISEFWEKNVNITSQVCELLIRYNSKTIQNIQHAKQTILDHVWWPFTQHKNIKDSQFIHSAHRQNFCIAEIKDQNTLTIQPKLDANQSWWTQNLGHGNAILAQEMAYAAGRYGHVMFPGYAHEPVANLIKNCLDTVGKGWATRVFFSDNGSTAIEVALKMAFKKKFLNHSNSKKIVILGLKDSYHGDTLGALDATEPNAFKNNEYWYHGERGIWIAYPQVYLKNQKIYIKFENEIETEFKNFDELFEFEKRKSSNIEDQYFNFFEQLFKSFPDNIEIGACLFEGIVLGACGMIFIDPLFLRMFVIFAQKHNIPVIIDDVFAGFWRLGFPSSSVALNVKPDIACFGKGVTGGTLTLGLTLANEAVFDAFLGDSLGDALLHGHSYSGNPIAISVASKAIQLIKQTPYFNNETYCLNQMWDKDLLKKISCLNNVKRCFALGSVFALEFNSKTNGYLSTDLKDIVYRLKYTYSMEVRPLGNVLYIMANFYHTQTELNAILNVLMQEFA